MKPNPFFVKKFSVEKSIPKFGATSVIFKNLPEVNNHPKFVPTGHPVCN
jgi:hypothetical protein